MKYIVIVQGQRVEIEFNGAYTGEDLINAVLNEVRPTILGLWELRDEKGHFMWPDKPIAQYAGEPLIMNLRLGIGG
jgi:hypothetical protein